MPSPVHDRARRIAGLAARLPRRRPLVLMYHGFGEPPAGRDPYDLFLPTSHLERQLDLLLQTGWRALDLDGYLEAYDAGAGRGLFHVTIDDGFVSVATQAASVLSARGVPATVFVLPGLFGGTSTWLQDMPDARLLSVEQLTNLRTAGVTLGVHGHDHQSMTSMEAATLRVNTVEARDSVTAATGQAPRAFAYPFGWHDLDAREAVAAAGFDVAFSLYDDDGRYAVSRVDVKPTDGIATFCAKLTPAYRRAWKLAGSLRPVRRGLRAVTNRMG